MVIIFLPAEGLVVMFFCCTSFCLLLLLLVPLLPIVLLWILIGKRRECTFLTASPLKKAGPSVVEIRLSGCSAHVDSASHGVFCEAQWGWLLIGVIQLHIGLDHQEKVQVRVCEIAYARNQPSILALGRSLETSGRIVGTRIRFKEVPRVRWS